uniref:U20-Liphistoxin-Lsp1a_1 n=1 Tax=Liphistius sp. SGP-2016 TaxID=1905180 RepID=A0A4Q8K5N5_9ARAC
MSLAKMVSACLLILLVTDILHVEAKPTKYNSWKDYEKMHGKHLPNRSENQCKNGGPIRDLCERCAKFTKNEIVFPLCCGNKEKVRDWCQNFLGYVLPE